MAEVSPFATSTIHHIGLRVADVKAAATWLTTMLGFRVAREFQTMGLDFIMLSPAGATSPVIELIGGQPMSSERYLSDDVQDVLKLPGLHHICLQVQDLDACMADFRRRDVRVLIDVSPAAPETGAEKIAFIADPWGNIYELLQATR
jgi:catechol 2,3-dioxygenase-like lactoylglutathione lyase family enzyme